MSELQCPHCSVEIDEHPASRCLDYWIAEQVLDLSCLHDPPTGILLPVDIQVKPYSSDIAAAWEVAEKMAEQWPDFSVGSGWIKGNDGNWSVSWGFDGHGWEWTEPCESAPLAICKAALLAVQQE